MRKKISRSTAKAVFYSTLAFGIFVFAQQIILLPQLASSLATSVSANVFIYMSVFSILTNSFGNELGITRQLLWHSDKYGFNSELFEKILKLSSALIFIVIFTVLTIIGLPVLDSSVLAIVGVLANIRLYLTSQLRLTDRFLQIAIQNSLYLVGIIGGVVIFKHYEIIWAPFLLGEFFAIAFTYIATRRVLASDDNSGKKDGRNYTIATFKNLSVISFLTNFVTYADRIIILPVIGPYATAVYYSGSTLSKMVGLLINPINTVYFTRLSALQVRDESAYKERIISYCYILGVIVFVISLPMTYLTVGWLYPQYSSGVLQIIIPIALICSLEVISTLLKTVAIKFNNPKSLSKIYAKYSIVFILASIYGGVHYGLLGFVIAVAISKLMLCIILVRLLSHKRGVTNETA